MTARLAGLSLLRGRRGVALAALCSVPLIPVALACFTDASGGKGALGFVDAFARFLLHWVLPVVCLYVGCAALGEEIEGRTLPYLLARPVPRGALLLGRALAGIVNAGVLLGVTIVVTYAATVGQMGLDALWIDLPMLRAALLGALLAVVAYTCFFLLLSVLTRWPLLIGIGLLFVWEDWAVYFPGTLARFTVLHHVYSLLSHWTREETFRSLASATGEKLLDARDSLRVLVILPAVALAFALLRFRRKAYLVA